MFNSNNQYKKNLFRDPSLWFLLISNVVTIFFAVSGGWSLLTVMWIYWFQSITIGFFNFIRILQLKEFSTERFTINNRPVKPTRGTKIFTAFFFLFHYSFFHAGYFVFLIVMAFNKSLFFAKGYENTTSFTDFRYILITALIFFVTHLFSYIYNKPRDTKKQNIGTLMFYPYARIIPMHLTIIFAFFTPNALVFFLVLKTFADCVMHIVEHSVIRGGEKAQPGPTY